MQYFRAFPEELEGVGIDVAIVSDVPLGGGLSSSAALEVATGTLIEGMILNASADGSSPLSGMTKALRCVEAEHEFAGVPCGIMDQCISALGKQDHALLLDCRSKETTHISLADESVALLVCNSNAPHELTGGEYASRVSQCRDAVDRVKAYVGEEKAKAITHLRDVDEATLRETLRESDNDEVKAESQPMWFRRALHGVTEDQRTLDAVKAAEKRDWKTMGQRMSESHASLRDLFEVSTPELDALVEIALKQDGVYGSRMTGGGFGGCTVTLVESDKADTVAAALAAAYPKHGKNPNGREATIIAVERAGQGARVLFSPASK